MFSQHSLDDSHNIMVLINEQTSPIKLESIDHIIHYIFMHALPDSYDCHIFI